MKVLSVENISQIVAKHGFDKFILDLIEYLKVDFSNWSKFDKSARYAAHVPGGVIELMPTADDKMFSYKCVNGHPANPFEGRQTVVATGQINEIKYGYPLLISEMTLLTALRTAAATVLATEYLARDNSEVLGIVGTGAQSEFQVLAHRLVRPIKKVKCYDTDPLAIEKFIKNMSKYDIQIQACDSAEEACQDVDIIVVCTACKLHAKVIDNAWVKSGVHINALGGDCPGKTELDKDILFRGKVIVEYKEQSVIEGEIQNLTQDEIANVLHAELWQIITKQKSARETDDEITIFDSVGFAVEDFSALRLVLDLAEKYDIGTELTMIPAISDPKDLYSVL